ncbi:MAG: GGDEF domain-containing protein [Campylobacterota bacterium]|nr:GGDEF domain-containing protein [Campylobacterota bacterium]
MNIKSIDKESIKNEKIQIFFRIFLVTVIIFTLPLVNKETLNISVFRDFTILHLFITVIIQNIIYYFIIVNNPYFFNKIRLFIVGIFDVLASVYVMYLVDVYSTYYPFLLLWYTIGYSMRYGNLLGYTIYFTVLLSWSVLISLSPIWQNHLSFGLGWLVAYIIIPLYTFRLVKELKLSISNLHENLDDSIYQAQHDQLTQLPNRKYFEKELNYSKSNYDKFALLFFDLDGFKAINDTHGHDVGDTVLVEVSKRIKKHGNFIARLGGDEFVSIVKFTDKENVIVLSNELIQSISDKCPVSNIEITASIGIAIYPEDSEDMHELKKKSDIAMYRAKSAGKNIYKFYSH